MFVRFCTQSQTVRLGGLVVVSLPCKQEVLDSRKDLDVGRSDNLDDEYPCFYVSEFSSMFTFLFLNGSKSLSNIWNGDSFNF